MRAAIEADFDRVGGSGRFDGDIPIACLERHLDLAVDDVVSGDGAEECFAAGVKRDVEIPVGEKPMRLLRDKKNAVASVGAGELSEVVEWRWVGLVSFI